MKCIEEEIPIVLPTWSSQEPIRNSTLVSKSIHFLSLYGARAVSSCQRAEQEERPDAGANFTQ